ncbi:uncharacterized protein LOC143254636 isoform X2 [Tachypleus tridentatus]
MVVIPISSYNDDLPIYKWSPLVFRGFKKNSYKFCATKYTDCGQKRTRFGYLIRQPCCKGLVCEKVGRQQLCITRWRWENTNEVYYP